MGIVIGDVVTTSKSKVTGIVKDIVDNPNGSARILLDVNGADRWTTV